MRTLTTLLILTCTLLASALCASTSITSDITTNTTWNNAGSPYTLDAATIVVDNGATLTIDTSGGNVEIQFGGSGYDFQIGTGAGDAGFLHIDASSGTVTFRLKENCNLVIDDYGQVLTTDASAVTYFENFDPTKTNSGEYDWGAISFAASSQYQSQLINVDITGGGNDGKDGALVVYDTEDNTPLLEDLTFDDCNTAAIRFDTKGVHTLRSGGITAPLSVTNTDYVFYLNAVTSTVPIRFPAPAAPSTPKVKLSGTCTVGDASNVSHWRFDDAYTIECASSSKVQVVRGSVRGTEQAKVTFQSTSGSPTNIDWIGLEDKTETYINIFNGLGAFAHLIVQHAGSGMDVRKAAILGSDPYVLSGMEFRLCGAGLQLWGSAGKFVVQDCSIGGADSSEWVDNPIMILNVNCDIVRTEVLGCGNATAININPWGQEVNISDCQITGDFEKGIYATSSWKSLNLNISRVLIRSTRAFGSSGIKMSVNGFGGGSPVWNVNVRNCTVFHNKHVFDQGIEFHGNWGATFNGLIEDCYIGAEGSGTGFNSSGILSGGSVTVRRTHIAGHSTGANCGSGSEIDYEFEDCIFSDNDYGLYDPRTSTSGGGHCEVSRCTFTGNTTYGAYDAASGDAASELQASDCHWAAVDGPSGSGPGSGDAINANVEYGVFLQRNAVGFLIGGSPGGASQWDVWESSSTNGDNLHILDSTPYFKWTFASDFKGSTQSAYEIEVDDNLDFGSTIWDTGELTSTDTEDEYAGSALTEGTVYYARIRLWSDQDFAGPWYYLTFRLNNAPPQVGNTNRTPSDTSSTGDWTPVLVWERPADSNEDPLHFQVNVSGTIDATAYAFTLKSWTTSSATGTTPTSLDARGQFETSVDSGSTWTPLPSDGVPAGDTVLVRVTMPDAWGLADTGVGEDWSWYVTAYDGFETGTASSTWTFDVSLSYTISGQLQSNNGGGLDSKTVRLYINGADSGDTDSTATDTVAGRFDIVTTDALEVGDVLWIYVDGETEKAAAVFHFTGDDIDYVGGSGDIILRDQCAYIYETVEGLTYANEDFEITDADTDIPWTYSSGTVTFKSSLDTDVDAYGEGVYLYGSWDMSEDVDGTTSLDTQLHVWLNGRLRTQGFDASFDSIDNKARIEILDGSTFTTDGADSTTTVAMVVDGSTLKFAGSSSLTLTVERGTFDTRNGATIEDLTANVSSVVVDASSSNYPAVLSCADTTFDEVKVTIEDDGVLGLFNDNIFQNDVSTEHIYWKSESDLSVSQMRGVQFNTSVNGSSTFNITASSTANIINMIGCGGVGQGEAYDSDSSSRVDWELTPPTGLALTLGDTRIQANWDASDQVDASAFGFNLYKAPFEDSTWTSAPSYAGGYTTFTDSSASFTSALAGLTFYPDASSTTSLTVYDVPTSTTIRVSGDYSSSASNGDTYSFFVKVNGSLLTTTSDEAESLTNGTTYYFYVTIDDSTEDAPADRNRGEARSIAPAASSISAVTPNNADSDSVLALSVIGDDTHWEGSTTVTITKSGGSGVTVNDTLIISAKLALVDATLSSATTGSWTVTVTEDDIWGIAAYDEVETASLTVSSNDADLADRPILVFSTNNSGIAADANTSGGFILNIDFTDNGNGIDTSTLEVYASRDIDAYFGGSSSQLTAGTELRAAGVAIEELDDTDATWTIEQAQSTNGDEDFADGEYTVTARVADDEGNYSDWASIRFYVEGGSADVAKTTTLLYQGDEEVDVVISGTFSVDVDDVDFGTGITLVSYTKDSSSQVTATVTVDEDAACGPRSFTVDLATGTDPVGIVVVEYPTNILPTVNNDEPSRNPAVGGVNVFLVNGEFFKSETDLAVRGRMMGISWSRFYRSQITYDGPLGHGWVGHYFQRAVIDSGTSDIWWYTPDGRKEVFPDVTGGYSSPVGVYVTASSETTHDTITLTDRHGYQCVFNADGRLWRCIDRNGNATECSYNYAGQLTTITNDLGETFTVTYGTDGRVSQVDDNMWNDGTSGHTSARSVEYTYDSDGNLTEEAAPETARYLDSSSNRTTYAYRYDDQHRLIACINPREFNESADDGAYIENFYDSSDRVIDQKLGDEADVEQQNGTKSAFIHLRYDSATFVIEVDRSGHRTDYSLDASGRATTVKRFTGVWQIDPDEPYDNTALDSGTATGVSATVLTDTGASWTADAFIGMTLRMGTAGTDHQDYTIVDNDSTTITVDSGSSLTGDGWSSSDAYAIYDYVTTTAVKLRSGDPTSFSTVFTYNSNHEILTITYPRGNKVTYDYPSGSSQTSGTCTSNPSATVLTDSGQSWTADAYIGMILRVGSNAGEYAYYPIVDNDATTITIESDGYSLSGDGWLSGEDYAVCDEASDPMAAGNVLSVTRSDEGLGSESDIVTTYTYEPRYQFVKTVTDPRSNTTTYTYDYEESAGNGADAGNLVLVTSPTVTGSMASSSTIETRTTYNEYGQPVTMTDGEGNVTYLQYYSSGSHTGFLYQRITAYGELDLTSEFEYDPVGNMTASWSPRAFESGATKDDFKTSYEVNELNQTWHVTGKYEVGDPDSSSLVSLDSYRYFDANGNLLQSFREYITDAGTSPSAPSDEDDPTTFSKSSSAMAATWVESSYTYNLLNYTVARTVDAIAGSAITQYTSYTRYDANYNTIASISPLGNRSRTVFDERDMVYQRVAGAYSDVAGTYQTDYDANGNVSSSFDALGNETTYTYDGFDRTTKVTDAAGHYRTSAYDANSNVTTSSAYDVFDTLLAQSTTTYDQINRAYVSARLANNHNGDPIGDGYNTSTTVFDKNSRVVSSTNDNGVTYTSLYDAANRTTETRDAVGNRTQYTYNANGATVQVDYFEVNGLSGAIEKSHVSYELSRSDVAWEVRDRRWSSDFDTSGKTKRDGWGRVTTSTDAASNTITTNYDLMSRVTDSTEEAGTDDIYTQFAYDDDSRTISRAIKRNPGASTFQTTEYVYDERSRLITLRRPDGDIWNYHYDENSNRLGWDDPLGTRVTDTFDERNLVIYRNIERGTGIGGADYESYDYDGLGRLTSCSNYADGELISASAWQYNTQSQAETHIQTVADKAGVPLGTWTTQAEYDATGLSVATIYSDGHRINHVYDQLDRLSGSYDDYKLVWVMSYLYAGPHRLIERTAGNGVRTSYEWEASGCGCGGATPYCERVEHKRVGSGEVLFSTDRRYDELGLVTVERRGHQGGLGNAYRYDEAKRLDTSYFGVDLYSTALDTYADQTNTPSTFGLKRAYGLDPRGNRSGSTGVADSDDSSGSVYDYSYTADDDTNQYTAVDGDSYTYDAIEQMTYDPATQLYHKYDYKGQLVATDGDSALTSPERVYLRDNQGRLVMMNDNGGSDSTNQICFLTPDAGDYACSAAAFEFNDSITQVASSGAELLHTISVSGSEVTSPGSSGAVNPGTVASPSLGRAPGKAFVFEFVDSDNNGENCRFLAHDQHGSTIGCTDQNGGVSDIYVYTDYGQTERYKTVFDCPDAYVSSVSSDTPSADQTTITVGTVLLGTDIYNGLELQVIRPEAASNRVLYGEVLDTTTSTIVVDDPGDLIYSALNSATQGFQVLDLPAAPAAPHGESSTSTNVPSYSMGVTTYTDAGASFTGALVGMQFFPETDGYPNVSFTIVNVPSGTTIEVSGDTTFYGPDIGDPYAICERCWVYDSGNDESDYFDASATFASYMVGWSLVPDVSKPCYLPIIAVDADNGSVTVQGDATGLATPLSDKYHVIPPPGVARSTGALAKPEDAGELSSGGTGSYDDPGTIWLWSGYRYVAPQVGHDVTGTTYGAQSGVNKLGNYHCWNRVCDVATGRWTTPDPAMSPWTNLQNYATDIPTAIGDPSGLDPAVAGRIAQYKAVLKEIIKSRGFSEALKWARDRGVEELAREALREYVNSPEIADAIRKAQAKAKAGPTQASGSKQPSTKPEPRPELKPQPKSGSATDTAKAPVAEPKTKKVQREAPKRDEDAGDKCGGGTDNDEPGKNKCTCEWALGVCQALQVARMSYGEVGEFAMCGDAYRECVKRRNAGKVDCWPHDEPVYAPDWQMHAQNAPDFRPFCPQGVK